MQINQLLHMVSYLAVNVYWLFWITQHLPVNIKGFFISYLPMNIDLLFLIMTF